MNRGIDHQPVFLADSDRWAFEDQLHQLGCGDDLEVHAYCLMGNHFHLVVRSPTGDISAAMQRLSSSYTRVFNERHHRDGPLFRGRFRSVDIETDEQLLATIAYVHRNPIDIVPAHALEAYRWSSYGVYTRRRRSPSWLRTHTVDRLLDPHAHRTLVTHALAERRRVIRPEQIIAIVDGLPLDTRTRRALLVVTLSEHAELSAAELTELLDFRSPASTRTALSRARAQRSVDADFDRTVTHVERELFKPRAA